MAHSLLLIVGLSLVGLSVSKKGEHAETVAWTVPVHVADLLLDGSFAALAAWRGPVFVEIGASDRNTMDVEMLPIVPDAFLITAEPLVDKWARGIGRRVKANSVQDSYEPLSRHHQRGIILPIAVSPTSNPQGESKTFYVGGRAGCSSLLNVSHQAEFGNWCRNVREPIRKIRIFGSKPPLLGFQSHVSPRSSRGIATHTGRN